MTAKLFEHNMFSMAPFGTIPFDNYNYDYIASESDYDNYNYNYNYFASESDYDNYDYDYIASESDCDSTNYYADKEYSDDDLEDSERDDISDVYTKEEDDTESFDNLSERSVEDDLYGPNNDFEMDNSIIDIYDEHVIIKMENSSPFGSEKQVPNFVNHYTGTIQAQNPNNESSDETVSIKMERYEYGSKTSGDETVCVKMDSRELLNDLEDDLPDNTINKIKIGSCKDSNCEKGDVHENYKPVEIKEVKDKIGSYEYSNFKKNVHENDRPVGIQDDLRDNTLHKVKIRPCEYSNCEKRDVHENNDQPVEIKIESFEDLKSLEEFLRDEAVRAKMSSHEPFSESKIKTEQTENCPSFDSLEEFLRYDETIRAKMEPCGRSFYDEERNLSANNQTVHVKMEPNEPFYGEERNLNDNNQTVHVKMEPYKHFYGEKRNLNDNNQTVHVMKPYEHFYSEERNLNDNNQTVHAKMEPYEPFYGEERNLNDNNQTVHVMEPYEHFYSEERNLNDNNQTVHAKMEPYEPFYGEERNLNDNNQTVHVMEPYEHFYSEERNLNDNNQTVHAKMEPYEPFYGEERNLNDNNQTVHVKMEPNEPFYGEKRNLSDNNQTVHVMKPYEPFYGEERNLNDNQTVPVKMEPYEPFYGTKGNLRDNQTVRIKMQSYEPFGNERNLSDNNKPVHIKMKSYESFYGAERNLSDKNQAVKIKVEPYESLHNEVYLSGNYRAKIDLSKQKEFEDSLEEFLRYDETIGLEMEPYGSFRNDNQTVKPCNEEYLSDDSYESPNSNGEYYKTFNENLRDGTTVNIKSDKLIRSEELNIDDSNLSFVNGDNCADFVDEQMNEYNLPNYNRGNAYSDFEGNNNIANKIADKSEINHHFWNYVPFFDIYSTTSRQSSKRKFEYEEQYSSDLSSTTKQNAYTTSLNETTGESSHKRSRLRLTTSLDDLIISNV
ncbi:hypothetical protein RhiirC2_864721 [Rhizophagus irregularis]|uniref:Uncharacterized protein n=1 Tax=Rhizophagus irregularis TaxID=588596 RepID=A0A2N1NGB1_9GLOM|nr:hypothetical protein RhiirC2_864721 [Rhizophagus irregularis]